MDKRSPCGSRGIVTDRAGETDWSRGVSAVVADGPSAVSRDWRGAGTGESGCEGTSPVTGLVSWAAGAVEAAALLFFDGARLARGVDRFLGAGELLPAGSW
jgi:L-aminopeptidase/D-esterase-like protein